MIAFLLALGAVAYLLVAKRKPAVPPDAVRGGWYPPSSNPVPPPPPPPPPAPPWSRPPETRASSPPEFPSLNERDAERDADPRPAIDRLLVVRAKLAADGRLNDANGKAVDQLMLELVHGRQLPDPKESP